MSQFAQRGEKVRKLLYRLQRQTTDESELPVSEIEDLRSQIVTLTAERDQAIAILNDIRALVG